MTTDIAVLERAVIVMAICMAVQTVLCIGAAIGAFVAWRRASEAVSQAKAIAEVQIAEVRRQLERVTATVEKTAQAVQDGTSKVDDVITDMRDAVGTVRNSVGTVVSVMTAPRAALAVGLWQGFKFMRKRHAAQRLPPAVTSEL